jgi:serine/threonine protein kinase
MIGHHGHCPSIQNSVCAHLSGIPENFLSHGKCQSVEPFPTRSLTDLPTSGRFVKDLPFEMEQQNPFGDYDIDSRISDAETTEIWTAVHLPSGNPVTMKVPKSNCVQNCREAELVAGIQHPGILPLLQTVPSEFGPILVYPFCAGGDLLDFVLAHGRLSEAQVRVVAIELLDAVSHLHNNAIWHRDIKPENILLSTTEITPGSVRLTDLGLSVAVEGDVVDGEWPGTRAYAAPELRHALPYTNKVDSYAIGRTLFVLLTGLMPDSIVHLPALGISRECIKFLFEMTRRDPDTRLSADEGRRHPWITNEQRKVQPVCPRPTLQFL